MAPSSEWIQCWVNELDQICKTRDRKILRTNSAFPWCETSDIYLREWILGCKMPRAMSHIFVELPEGTNAATPRASLEGMKDQINVKINQLTCVFKDMQQNTEITQITILCLCDITKATNLEHGEELHGLLLIKHLNLRCMVFRMKGSPKKSIRYQNQMNRRDIQEKTT